MKAESRMIFLKVKVDVGFSTLRTTIADMDDTEMGYEEKVPAALGQRLSAAAFNALKDKGVHERELQLQLQGEQVNDKVEESIRQTVHSAYLPDAIENRLSMADFKGASDAAIAELRVIQSETPVRVASSKPRDIVPAAFDMPYEGGADVSFQKHLVACCHAYINDTLNDKYTAPYVTITQSSGFGKSRIVKRLAEKDGPIEHNGTRFDVKVLYICARTIERSSGTSNQPVEKRKKLSVTPVLVVAIDEARSLLEIKGNRGKIALQYLRQALITVNRSSTVRKASGLIFGVLVDTNPLVHESAVEDTENMPSLMDYNPKTVLFPPFVLTETMDIMVKKLGDDQKTSKSRVLTTDEDDVWTALVSMGRPLWRSVD
ncbi:hypothetical protein P3T76_002240 [Phytophthora citrophthora]|uniref:Uncharacterized protein n=1 Tax=Phytophthora citrophthora TaxID=4793 RepID=A0AAD9LRB7_9STRA|nr:hypothetical protein P3T76_002240 [Phytophthora citrophthora]